MVICLIVLLLSLIFLMSKYLNREKKESKIHMLHMIQKILMMVAMISLLLLMLKIVLMQVVQLKIVLMQVVQNLQQIHTAQKMKTVRAGSTTAEPANGSGGGKSASRSSSSTAVGSSVTANQSVDDSVQVQQQQTRPTTRLQRGIRKEKVYTDGTVRYSFLASSSEEPQSLNEALADSNWKQAMDTEFTALIHNKTWHLVPP